MKLKRKFTYIAVAFISLFFIMASMLFSVFTVQANAEELHLRDDFEKRNVLDDLEGSERDGVPFSVESYGFKSNGITSLFSFIEFCYSFHENMQDNYGLYIYVYNQKGLQFDTESDRNMISLRAGDDASKNYTKYHLEFLNMSDKQDYEGLFYKFKVLMSAAQQQAILDEVNGSKRSYRVGDAELVVKGKQDIELITVGTNFWFTGYAQGFGANAEAESTLKMDYEHTDTLQLKPVPVFFRPEGSNGKNIYTQDSLHSVYFAVPNYFIRTYGEMAAVHATWLNAVLKPMLVTGNQDVYNAVSPFLGTNILTLPHAGEESLEQEEKSYYSLVAGYNSHTMSGPSVSVTNTWCDKFYGNHFFTEDCTDRRIPCFYFMFDSGGGTDSADSYIVSSEEIRTKMLESAQKFGGDLVNGKYSRKIFESVEEDFEDVNWRWDKKFPLTDKRTEYSFWQYLWNHNGKYEGADSGKYKEINAIYKLDKDANGNWVDFVGTDREIADRLFVQEKFISDLKNYCNSPDNTDSTVYLFRYKVSDYFAMELSEFKGTYRGTGTLGLGPKTLVFREEDTNARFFQESVDLDFDIIDVTFSQGEKETVIPVGMKPIDVIHDGTPARVTTSDKRAPSWWQIALFVVGVLLLVWLLNKTGILTFILQGIVWIVCLPFRLIAYPFKAIKRRKQQHKRE